MNHEEAMNFFMRSDQYHGFELPEYFEFDEVLKFVRETISGTPYEDCLQKDISPKNLPDVNMEILLNKDGRYAVRPIILANPYLYYFLVREVCSRGNWDVVQGLFEKFNVPHITSCAIPIIPAEKESFHKSTTILNWWSSVEQRAIELSLEYRYMFVTDITNCYGSVNPQSFDWAFALKDTQYEASSASSIGKNIQKYLRAFQQGRNIGIPQGSAIFDFVGEIVLGYSDLIFHEAIDKAGIKVPYEIIRYRDDYRIFCNDKNLLENISYILQRVLESLNFRMNSQKTFISDSIVTDAVKPDKLAYIYNTPIYKKHEKVCVFESFEKHLLFILMFARKYPDSGSVRTMLSDIDKRVEVYLKEGKNEDTTGLEDANQGVNVSKGPKDEKVSSKPKGYNSHKYLPGGSVRAMSAICTQIALENVNCSHYALRVMSRIIESLKSEEEKWDIRNKVYDKLCNQPNSTYNQLWLQNITYQRDKKAGSSPYTMRLCRLAAGENVFLWDNSWLKEELVEFFPQKTIINSTALSNVTPVITFRETRAYMDAIDEMEDIIHIDIY